MAIPLQIGAKTATGHLDIGHIANLARINISVEEALQFSKQLVVVLAHFERLNQVDVSGVEPMAHAAPVFNVWADDVARPGLPVELALKNAPAQRDHMVVVPKVVE